MINPPKFAAIMKTHLIFALILSSILLLEGCTIFSEADPLSSSGDSSSNNSGQDTIAGDTEDSEIIGPDDGCTFDEDTYDDCFADSLPYCSESESNASDGYPCTGIKTKSISTNIGNGGIVDVVSLHSKNNELILAAILNNSDFGISWAPYQDLSALGNFFGTGKSINIPLLNRNNFVGAVSSRRLFAVASKNEIHLVVDASEPVDPGSVPEIYFETSSTLSPSGELVLGHIKEIIDIAVLPDSSSSDSPHEGEIFALVNSHDGGSEGYYWGILRGQLFKGDACFSDNLWCISADCNSGGAIPWCVDWLLNGDSRTFKPGSGIEPGPSSKISVNHMDGFDKIVLAVEGSKADSSIGLYSIESTGSDSPSYLGSLSPEIQGSSEQIYISTSQHLISLQGGELQVVEFLIDNGSINVEERSLVEEAFSFSDPKKYFIHSFVELEEGVQLLFVEKNGGISVMAGEYSSDHFTDFQEIEASIKNYYDATNKEYEDAAYFLDEIEVADWRDKEPEELIHTPARIERFGQVWSAVYVLAGNHLHTFTTEDTLTPP